MRTAINSQSRYTRLFRRIGPLEKIGLFCTMVVTFASLSAHWLTPFDPYLRVAEAYLPPSAGHWFGTDEIGRDQFSRVILGLQYTWLPSLAVVAVSAVIGASIGLISGAIGGRTDMVVQQITTVFLTMPATIIALAVAAVLGPGTFNAMFAMMLTWWPWFTRIARDEIIRIKAQPHLEAARVSGIGPRRMFCRYMVPGAMPAIIIAASLDVSNAIMTLSLMSFLGLGQAAPIPELGAMTARSLENLTAFWWLPITPAIAIFLICLSANLAGDGLRSAIRNA